MDEMRAAIQPVDLLLTEMPGVLTNDQKQALQAARAALQRLSRCGRENDACHVYDTENKVKFLLKTMPKKDLILLALDESHILKLMDRALQAVNYDISDRQRHEGSKPLVAGDHTRPVDGCGEGLTATTVWS
jgi:hypothetical protein